jgi:hypothetical protein
MNSVTDCGIWPKCRHSNGDLVNAMMGREPAGSHDSIVLFGWKNNVMKKTDVTHFHVPQQLG